MDMAGAAEASTTASAGSIPSGTGLVLALATTVLSASAPYGALVSPKPTRGPPRDATPIWKHAPSRLVGAPAVTSCRPYGGRADTSAGRADEFSASGKSAPASP